MAISITVSRKMLVATLLFALLLWGASLALAVYDLNIIHACLDDKENLNCADKNGSYKSDETLVDLVTEAASQAQMDSLQAKIEALQTQASINAATRDTFTRLAMTYISKVQICMWLTAQDRQTAKSTAWAM